ncbi:sulfurtransferase complex subunit TusD [Aeromonas simiae]|uniref:sulfurtransferase complex subunit TusD n=1 Tax=Aeromonas simiae TaxID=218936 RepID=UPI0005A9AC81|nr:sulfurtransferase complex subunit TusD [Aeromonas simiae]
MSLTFAILVTAPPYGIERAHSAYRFARQVLEQGHRISHLFFYGDGVANANFLHAPASDEVDLVQRWRELAEGEGLCLDVCVAAAMRRGVIDAGEAQAQGKAQHNLAAPFVMSGLGQLAEAALEADRFVQF